MSRERRAMPAVEHLEELRWRLIGTLVPWALLTALAFAYADEVLAWLSRPVGILYVTSPAEAFFTQLRVALYLGAALAFPFAVYHAIAFASPGLTRDERRLVLAALPAVALLFAGGVAFGYVAALPILLRFFLSFTSPALQPLITLGSYLSFVVGVVMPFGVAFQLPLLVWLLARLGLVTAERLRRSRRYAVVAILVLAGVVTPPDVVSQLLLAGPMLLLYEAGVLLAGLAGRQGDGGA